MCFKYPTNDQISQIKEVLGDEWDKNRICQYIYLGIGVIKTIKNNKI